MPYNQEQLIDCTHCFGSGMCMDSNFLNFMYWACRKCIMEMRPDLDFKTNQFKVTCSICRGKGKLWLGPEQETILNNGIFMPGGFITADNIAVGTQSKVESHSYTQQTNNDRQMSQS